MTAFRGLRRDRARGGRTRGAGGFEDLRSVGLILTSDCNLRCSYCYQNRKRHRRMEWPIARAAVDLLFRSRRRALSLGLLGGEPLLEFSLFRRVVDHALAVRPIGVRLRFVTSTNGMLLDEVRAAYLAAHDVRTGLSFDGVPQAQRLRGRETFPVLDRLLDRLRRSHPEFYQNRLEISMTLSRASLPYLAESVRYFLRKGVGTIVISPRLTHDPAWEKDDFPVLERELSRVYRTCLRHYEETGEVPLECFRDKGGEGGGRRRRAKGPICAIGSGRALAVDVDGQVQGCALLATSYQVLPSGPLPGRLRAMRLGGIRDRCLAGRLERYRRSVEAAGIFGDRGAKYSSYGRCGDCPYIESCEVCPMCIGYAPGNTDPRRVPDLPCAWNLVLGKYRARFPSIPRPIDLLTGRAHIPGRISALLGLGGARRGREDRPPSSSRLPP